MPESAQQDYFSFNLTVKNAMKKLILLFMVLTGHLVAQTSGTLSGFVYDASNGEALIGANVFIKENFRGSTTNLNGYFVIHRLSAGSYTLVCQYIGYQPYVQKILVNEHEKKSLVIRLKPESIEGEEIVITADSISTITRLFEKPVSQIELSGKEIGQIPFIAESDLLRSLQTLPGILPLSDFSSELYVRGGTPDQNLYLIDGTDVYNPDHAFGIFSTFNTDAIKKVEISKGGFGAEYGGRLSSVLHVTNLDGNREKFEGTASVGILAARTTLQMPIGKIGSVSGSIRRTYFDQTIAKMIDEIPDYYFYDGNLKAFFQINDHNHLTLSGYGGNDVLHLIFNEDSRDNAGFDYIWGNRTGSIRWTSVFSPQLFANFWITGSRFRSDFDFKEGTEFSEHNLIRDITLKTDMEYYYSHALTMRFGFEQKNLYGKYRQSFPGFRVDAGGKRTHYAAYMQGQWQPHEDWRIEPGLRLHYFDSEKNFFNADPRLTVKYRLNETSNLKGSTGIYHQYLFRIPRPFLVGIWTSADRYQKSSSAVHFILGYQQNVADLYQIEIETYLKNYHRIYTLNQQLIADAKPTYYDPDGTPVYADTRGNFHQGNGQSIGMELMIKKEGGPVTGWVGYSLAKTEYRFRAINNHKPFVPRHDRTSAINAVLNADIRNVLRSLRGERMKNHRSKWLLGINFVYTSGQPITLPGSIYYVSPTPDGFPGVALFPDEINAYRLPPYARMDVSLTWERRFSGWTLSPYVQIFNIGNRKNVWFISYQEKDINDPNLIRQKAKVINMFPFLPTAGFNVRF